MKALTEAYCARIGLTAASMLASASDADIADLATVKLMLLATIFGKVRNVFARSALIGTGCLADAADRDVSELSGNLTIE